MAKYAIRVIEKLARTVIVEAEDLDTANAEVQSAYEKGEINLDSDDFEEYELAPAGWSDNGKVPKGRDVSLFDKIQQNTCIGYLYRDASNYKVYNKAIVPGRFSEEQIDRILSSLEDGEYFLPRKVGFEEEKFDDTTEDDHLLFELTRNDFEPTSEKATVESSPEEIVKLFESAKGHWLEGVLL